MPKEINRLDAFLSIPYGQKPEEQTYWAALASAIRSAANEISVPSLEIHSADKEMNALALKKSVMRLIDKCHFTIAVITGKNPNIFWEIGYTEAQKKPVVYLVDQNAEALTDSPVLISEALKCPYKNDEIIESIEQKKPPQNLSIRLTSFIDQAYKAVLAKPKRPNLQAFGNREQCNLPKMIAEAEVRIHLITTNLSYFSDENNFVVETLTGKQYAFDPPVSRGIEVKILTMDPESPMVKYRAEQLGLDYDVGVYRDMLKSSAKNFYQRYKSKPNVSVRLYDDLPLQIALIVDDVVMTSIITRGSPARKNLHFIMDMNLPGAESFEKHFSEVAAGPCKHITAFKWAGE